jgi:8-hydroxy-5-deazaflavin:NADPH oxidoreductase
MHIAVIGSGNVGGALATKWSSAGHTIYLGTRDQQNFKGKALLRNARTSVHPIREACQLAEVILIAAPATAVIQVTRELGDTANKVIIDAMNIIQGRGPQGFANTSDAILAHTATREVVKCFNTTGYNNMINPAYGQETIDLFVCGDNEKGKKIARDLALDAGFAECYDIGGNDKFQLMEQFAWFWINLAMNRGLGREIAFKLFRR